VIQVWSSADLLSLSAAALAPHGDWFGDGSISVAWARLIFNVTVGLAFVLLLDKVEPILSRRFGIGA
jgi:hypothetical protein